MISIYWFICHESDIRLWNLTSRERLGRMLDRIGSYQFVSDLEDMPPESSVLIIRGDCIYDERVFRSLSNEKNIMLEMELGGSAVPVVAHVTASEAGSVLETMQTEQFADIPNVRRVSLNDISGSFSNELRKTDLPYVFPILIQYS